MEFWGLISIVAPLWFSFFKLHEILEELQKTK